MRSLAFDNPRIIVKPTTARLDPLSRIVRGQVSPSWQYFLPHGHPCHCWRDVIFPIITAMTMAQIPALLLIVASVLAPYGVARVTSPGSRRHPAQTSSSIQNRRNLFGLGSRVQPHWRGGAESSPSFPQRTSQALMALSYFAARFSADPSRSRCAVLAALRVWNACTIWEMPMMTSQMPAARVSMAMESNGHVSTTKPPITETMPVTTYQSRPGQSL
jgi:hypothetical protein